MSLYSPFMTTSPSLYSPFFAATSPLTQNWETNEVNSNEVNRQQPIQEYQISERAREAFFFGPSFSAPALESGCQDTERVTYPRRRKPSSPAIFLQQYSTKVFIGGLPIGIVCETLYNNFIVFGALKIDWPKKTSEHSNPTDGYAFVVFEQEVSVLKMLQSCVIKGNRVVHRLHMPNSQSHSVEIKVWELKNAVYVGNHGWRKYRRFSVFIGGLPRTCSADFLVGSLESSLGNIVYCSIEQDKWTQYPKGAARVVFASKESYIKSIAVHELPIRFPEGNRKIEIKPFLASNMPCDKCGVTGSSKFCKEMICLAYFCDGCWKSEHSRGPGMSTHEAMKKTSRNLKSK
ncbi:RNA recognition motif domain-containing protein [Ditylenchus destructor]|uniref:RNA recognition motif domain-containing protein n=1 Tax=Ditylenchus destructor TaxID=166010 RepID=A0AAD4QY65_9BILA|nr:RNA recognition motif domain-containing protein [Ditylenchus destructor]